MQVRYARFSNVMVALPLSTVEMFECGIIMPKLQYLTVVNLIIIGFMLLIIGDEELLSTLDFRMR